MRYRDLNETAEEYLARQLERGASVPQNGPAGIIDFGANGDARWIDPAGSPRSVKDMDAELSVYGERMDKADRDLADADAQLAKLADDLNASKTNVDTALSDSAAAREAADAANGTASQASQDAQDAWNKAVEAEKLASAVVRLESSRGVLFKDNQVSTVLTVTVHRGDQIIDNILDLQAVYGAGSYVEWQWQRYTDDTFGVISSADSRIGNGGFSLTLTPADVDTKTVFRCTVNGAA